MTYTTPAKDITTTSQYPPPAPKKTIENDIIDMYKYISIIELPVAKRLKF